jgi:hypothetical protein
VSNKPWIASDKPISDTTFSLQMMVRTLEGGGVGVTVRAAVQQFGRHVRAGRSDIFLLLLLPFLLLLLVLLLFWFEDGGAGGGRAAQHGVAKVRQLGLFEFSKLEISGS